MGDMGQVKFWNILAVGSWSEMESGMGGPRWG